jgi:hypothetical protein
VLVVMVVPVLELAHLLTLRLALVEQLMPAFPDHTNLIDWLDLFRFDWIDCE